MDHQGWDVAGELLMAYPSSPRGDIYSNAVRSVPGRLSHDPVGSSNWRCSGYGTGYIQLCVTAMAPESHCPWASGSATPSCHCSSSTAIDFPLGLAIADVAVQAPNSKYQSSGTGFSASQLVSIDPWDTFPEHWGTTPEKMQKYFNIFNLGMYNGQGTKSTLVLCVTQT